VRKPSAFTLIELMLVLGLLAIVMLLALPTFQNLLQGDLQREVNHLAGVIRLLRNEAVLTHTRFRLVLEPKENRFHVEEENLDGQYVRREQPKVLREHGFPSSFGIKDVVHFGEVIRTDRGEPIPIQLDPSGMVDPFLLHFTEGDTPYTLRVSGFTGRVELLDGHVDE
jgi:prepilin-type N-terminal cleavage/methylation domain-containing protein